MTQQNNKEYEFNQDGDQNIWSWSKMPDVDNWTGCVGDIQDKRISDLKSKRTTRNGE